GACLVEPVQDPALVEQLGLLCVDVLAGEWVVVVELARLEADDTAARIGEREQQPPLEVVAAALPREARCAQLLRGEPLRKRLARQRVAAEREPEPELAADLLVQAAALEVVACERADLGVPERPLVVRGRGVEQRVQALGARSTFFLLR